LFGRGASDMKSSTGVMIYLMGLFKDAPIRGCLQAHVVSDEETSAEFGTLAVLDAVERGQLPRPTYCLIGEKSDLKVRNAERGILGMEVTFHGRASHTASARATGSRSICRTCPTSPSATTPRSCSARSPCRSTRSSRPSRSSTC
jgi:acetylornithine deacetylase